MEQIKRYSYLSNAENLYVEGLYEDYRKNPDLVDISWQKFFEGFEFALSQGLVNDSSPVTPSLASQTVQNEDIGKVKLTEEFKVFQLIMAYRERGHFHASIDPISERPEKKTFLTLQDFGLHESDLEKEFCAGSFLGLGTTTLATIISTLQGLYMGPIGIEFMHIESEEIKKWIQDKFESTFLSRDLSFEEKKRVLLKLNHAEGMESFLQTKYVGQKRFSLEGGDNAIPGIDALINHGAANDVQEVVIAMAHRGRLNVLANIMGKSYEEIFFEFEGKALPSEFGDGDVKYHLGLTSKHTTPCGKDVILKLMPNPSHLECVAPVAQGYIRAKGEILYKQDFKKIIPLQIHGDSALAGQGVVFETIQMSKLAAYQTGGSIHLVINNQIGFTTDSKQARSSEYATSVARVVSAPVLHVNGDDAEALVYAMKFAVDFRQKFGQDVFIDLVCYRKYGHNESDEPKFTQPALYQKISKHPCPRETYTQTLIQSGSIGADLAKEMREEFKSLLQDRFQSVKKEETFTKAKQKSDIEWENLRPSTPEDFFTSPETRTKKEQLEEVLKAITAVPEHINPISKLKKLMEARKNNFAKNTLDWSMAELFAYGTLLLEGHAIRISGQDARRGTFSHRHAYAIDEKTQETYSFLSNISDHQAPCSIYNSHLSEYAVLGFEYGHSLGRPKNLTIWEAQFGDFANSAQIIIDQFISAAESKWETMSGLVLLLPHGHEGQGPEHSSAKPERYLQLCAEFNMIVANVTTPASFFHIIRRQLKYPFRKPLVIFSPKSLLRHPKCQSKIEDLTDRNFEEILDDSYANKNAKKIKRVLLCTGKIYYDLHDRQQSEKRTDVAIIRLEQLHPIPFEQVDKILNQYKNAEFVWIQEEPKNMGFWNYILRKLDYYNLDLISRKSSASTATGYMSIHLKEQKEILDRAFDTKNYEKAKKRTRSVS